MTTQSDRGLKDMERYRIAGIGNTDWYMRDWKQMTTFLDTKLLYAVEDIEEGGTLNIQIDRIQMSDEEFDELVPEDEQ